MSFTSNYMKYDQKAAAIEMFLGESRGDVLKFSHAMIDAGADLIISHGPHVMRGNLSAGCWSRVGGILRVTPTTSGDYVRGTLTRPRR
jgi:hypothetical protein